MPWSLLRRGDDSYFQKAERGRNSAPMLAPLFGYFFCMITMLTAVVVVLTGFSNISTSKQERHHLRPPVIGQTVMVETQRHSPVAKEEAPAKDPPLTHAASVNCLPRRPPLALRASRMRYFSLAAIRCPPTKRLPTSFPAASRTKNGETSSSEMRRIIEKYCGLWPQCCFRAGKQVASAFERQKEFGF